MSLQVASSIYANLAEYSNPELYDAENVNFEPDGPFFLALAQQAGGPVLEMGCGTGRLTIPLAQHNIPMTGLDIMPGMLARAREKAAGLPVQWVEADARTMKLDQRFRLIFDHSAAFQHVLERTDHEAILARVREHLDVDGHFILTNPFIRPTTMMNQEEQEWFTYTTQQGQTVHVSGTVRHDLVQQVYHEDAARRWRDANGQEFVHLAPLARRVFFPPELEALLHYNGFTIIHRYGNLDCSPLTDTSPMMIFVAKQTV